MHQDALCLSLNSFLSTFSTGLGIAATVAPGDDTTEEAVGAFSTSVSNIGSIVALLHVPSSGIYSFLSESTINKPWITLGKSLLMKPLLLGLI